MKLLSRTNTEINIFNGSGLMFWFSLDINKGTHFLSLSLSLSRTLCAPNRHLYPGSCSSSEGRRLCSFEMIQKVPKLWSRSQTTRALTSKMLPLAATPILFCICKANYVLLLGWLAKLLAASDVLSYFISFFFRCFLCFLRLYVLSSHKRNPQTLPASWNSQQFFNLEVKL